MTSESMFEVEVRHNVRIPMRDGIALSANLWMPIPNNPQSPIPDLQSPIPNPPSRFPAILEMIPYRKDDWRYISDHRRGHYFAQRGYVFCRLDVRGTGSSQGLALDEYTPAETQDGYDTVEWLAAQPWCNGNVGMWGISYGGFTSIQVAKLQPPHLKAIVPMYATDDRYTDDVHYLGGCLTASELAQYAVSQIAMNAMPPAPEHAGQDWAGQWKARLEQTPPWLIEWLKQQVDGPYWRNGSLAPDYDRITCAIYSIGGWMDGYTNPVLRMHEKCVNAPRKSLIGNWVHSLPDSAYPGPNLDYLHEMVRFFDYWLKGVDTGVMDEPPLTVFLREYTPPEPFPASMNGHWHTEAAYPIARTQFHEWYLGDSTLTPAPLSLKGTGLWQDSGLEPLGGHIWQSEPAKASTPGQDMAQYSGLEPSGGHIWRSEPASKASTPDQDVSLGQWGGGENADHYPHRPTLGTHAALCWGAGVAPNGLARDLRPDEALSLTYTGDPLAEPLDIIGFPEAILYLSCSAPVAHVVVRLTDVAPDGTSAQVTAGILNLTHRNGHTNPQPLIPDEVYEIRVQLKATGYRFLSGHRIRLSVASAYWPVIFPSPYRAGNALHRGGGCPSRLRLPVVPPRPAAPAPPAFKTTPPDLISLGAGSEEPGVWRIVEDVIDQSVTVKVYGGDTSLLPNGVSLSTSERIDLTAYHHDPAHVRLTNEVNYHLKEHGYETHIRSSGAIRSTATDFHIDIQLEVRLNGRLFFQKSWLESVPRRMV